MDGLINDCNYIINLEDDPKFLELLDCINENNSEKWLIFTEYNDTLVNIVENFKKYGYTNIGAISVIITQTM